MPDGEPTSAGPIAADDRYIVVSTDSHVGPSVKDQLRE